MEKKEFELCPINNGWDWDRLRTAVIELWQELRQNLRGEVKMRLGQEFLFRKTMERKGKKWSIKPLWTWDRMEVITVSYNNSMKM